MLSAATLTTLHNTGANVAGAKGQTLKPVVQSAVKHDTSAKLQTIKPTKSAKLAQAPNKKATAVPLHDVPHAQLNSAAKRGSADVQTSVVTNNMPAFQQNFEGVGNLNGVLPPDTQGAVGPNNYVQMINLSFAIWNKQGTLLYGPVPNTTLWQGFGGPCETFNGGDPITMYDETADRWFMSQLAYPGGAQGYHECIAISQTGDPTGAWYRYDFLFSSNTLNDYPKFGIWPDAYYMSANDFLNAASFTGVTVIAFDRAQMLAGQQATTVSFTIGSQYSSLLPANADGGALGFNPPAGAPEQYFSMCDDASGSCSTDQIQMWNFHVDWTTPANSTFGNNGAPSQIFQTAPFDSNLCNFNRSCIPQPSTSVGLDALSDRLMYRADYRNLGGTQAVVFDDSVNVNGANQAGIRWYELTNSGSGWSINQQSTYAPDSDNRWMGSAALDASGDIAIGFSVSSASTFPSIRVAGRLAGDPSGQLSQGETTMMAGTGSQTSGFSRWGDYSAMQVDPTDGCTFWYTNEYLTTTSDSDWHTRIGSFKFPSCTAGPHGNLAGTVTDASTGKAIVGAIVATNVGSTTTDQNGSYQMTLAAGTYNVTYSAFGYATKTVTGVQITNGATTTENEALTPSPSVHVTGTITDGSGHGWPLYARIDITGRPGGPLYTNPATGQYSVTLPENAMYSVTYTANLPGYTVATDTIAVGTTDVTHNVQILVDPACTAPGYQFQYGTPVLNEPFDGTTMPAGWTVVDNKGNGQVWQIGDPENRGNLTGGQGNFADINSDHYGPGNSQDTSLVTPTIDLSGTATPIMQFHNDYFGFPGQTGNVDLSTDGGQTWTTVWHHTTDSVRGPDLEQVAIPQAGGKSAVQLRFHFISSFGWWWEVDDVAVMNRACAPTPGGLVVGNVTDGNTGLGLNGATVTSNDHPATKATTMHTDDPNVGDGYYWLFSSLTGSHGFTASKGAYQSSTQAVNVVADNATRANFSLGAAQLTITPSSISQSQVLGSTTTSTVNIKNTGTAPANFTLDQRSGSFTILTQQGAPLRLIQFENGEVATPAFLGNQKGDNNPGVSAGQDQAWSTIAPYPSAIMDNSADFIGGKEYSVGGIDSSFAVMNKGYVYDPNIGTWTAIANMPVAREKPNVAAVNGKLYVSGGWDTSGNPVAETDVYDPATDSWSTVSPNPHPTTAAGVAVANGKIYLVAGCADAFCTAATTVEVYDPSSDSWSSAAAYPFGDSWLSCGGINALVYCVGGTNGSSTFKTLEVYDTNADSWSNPGSGSEDLPIDLWASAYGAPNGTLVVSSGVTNGFSTLTNQAYQFDPSNQTWTQLPNAQFTVYRAGGSCGFYKIGGSTGGFSPSANSELLSGLDQCGVTHVPWLADSPSTGTLNPGQSVNVTVTLSATTADQVTQPGTYTASLGVENNTPYKVNPINITMTVTPPSGWGKITGTVTGTNCKGNTAPLGGVQVQANGKGYTFTLKTDKNGNYAFWAPAASNAYQIIASDNGWIAQAVKVNIKAQKTVTVNFDLVPTAC